MATSSKRHVKRSSLQGRQAIVRQYNSRAWYQLPDWAADFFAGNLGWIALGLAILLTPAALLATVLGVHSLPLEFFGIPASDNGVGVAAAVFIAEFILLVAAVRPLIRRLSVGWLLLLLAAAVQFAHSLLLQHGISGGLLLLLAIYLYWQTRQRFS